jgi:amino acid transporter
VIPICEKAVSDDAGPEQGLQQSMTWKGGFILALVIPMSGLTLVGYEIGAIGAYGALAVWVGTSLVALFQNYIFAELAGMFPHKSGGISIYASEAWSKYFAPLGGILGWGYWVGWSFTLGIVSLVIGGLVQAEWFPHVTGTISILGNPIGLPTYIAAGLVTAIYLINIAGLKPVINTNIVIGITLALLAAICIVGPIVLHKISAATLTFTAGHSAWQIIVTLFTWAFVATWTSYGTEVVATFTPEYKDPHHDVGRALRSASLLMIVVCALSTTIFPAAVGQSTIANNPIGFFAPLVSEVVGKQFGGIAIAIICVAQLIALGSATSDSGRVLYGMAAERLTFRQLYMLNGAGQPARAMTVDLVANLLILFLISNVAGIIFSSNLGYLLSIVFALGGFLVLRKTRPNAERPIRLGKVWIPIAWFLVAFNVFMIVIGFTHPSLVGYGGSTEQLLSLSVIVVGFLSYLYARVVQDKQRFSDIWGVTPSELGQSNAVGSDVNNG